MCLYTGKHIQSTLDETVACSLVSNYLIHALDNLKQNCYKLLFSFNLLYNAYISISIQCLLQVGIKVYAIMMICLYASFYVDIIVIENWIFIPYTARLYRE